MTAFRAAFAHLHFSNEDVIVADDKVTVRSVVTGTQEGTFLGVAPTERSATFRTIDIYRIKDDYIVETWHFVNVYSFLLQAISDTIEVRKTYGKKCVKETKAAFMIPFNVCIRQNFRTQVPCDRFLSTS